MPSLMKVGDPSRGDSGAMSDQVWIEDGEYKFEAGKPVVGRAIRVGSITARSYSAQDWFQTSEVVEILEETEGYVKFKTYSGSTYEWKA